MRIHYFYAFGLGLGQSLALANPISAEPGKSTTVTQERKQPVSHNEDSTAGTQNAVENITVIGQKLSRTQQETKESVSIITDEMLETLPLFEFKDVFNKIANAYSINNGENFGIRGVTQNSSSTGGGDGELGTLYIDGVAYTGFSTRFGPKDLWDVEQIEILRGPQSTNVGRNALIGAVVVTTKKPEPGLFDSAIRLQAGSYNKWGVDGMVNLSTSDDSALRLSVQHAESDGFIENSTLNKDDYDGRTTSTARGQYRYQPSETVLLDTVIQLAQTKRGQSIYRADLNAVDSFTSSANLEAHEDYDAMSAALTLAYDVSDNWRFNAITSFIEGDYSRFDDDDKGPAGSGFQSRKGHDKNWGQELRFNYSSTRLKGLAGLFYTKVNVINDTVGRVTIEPATLGVPDILLPFYPEFVDVDVFTPFEQKTTNIAFFTEWDYALDKHWTLSSGIRYEDETQNITANVSNTLAQGFSLPDPAISGQQAEQVMPGLGAQVEAGLIQVNSRLQTQLTPTNFPPEQTGYEAFLPQIGLTYRINADMSLSGFYKRGYRAGGVDINVSGARSDYGPEFLDNIELAFRSTLLDGDMTMNANAYYGDWKDQQVSICPDNNLLRCQVENAGESEIYGAELDIDYSHQSNWNSYISMGYAHTEFTGYDSAFVELDLTGRRFAFSPEFSASIGSTYTFWDDFYMAGSLSYQGESYADTQNTTVLDARVLLDVTAGYYYKNIKIDVFVLNLADTFYITSDGTGFTPGSRLVQAGNPRELGIRFTATL